MFQQGAQIWSEIGNEHLHMQALAGLAQLAHAQGDIDAALAQIEPIVAHLQAQGLRSELEPFRTCWTCYEILKSASDNRAPRFCSRHMSPSNPNPQISIFPEMVDSYLGNVRMNRKIITERFETDRAL